MKDVYVCVCALVCGHKNVGIPEDEEFNSCDKRASLYSSIIRHSTLPFSLFPGKL